MTEKFTEPELVEASHVLDIFATELSRIERIGSCVRFTLTSYQSNPNVGSERVVVCKLVMPMDAVPAAIRNTITTLMLPTISFWPTGPQKIWLS